MNQQNQDFFPWDEVPDQDVLSTGNYLMRGRTLEDGASGDGKRMFPCHMEVEQPEQFKGMSLFENFVTGTDEMLANIVPASMGTRRMKKMVASAQIPGTNSVAQMCAAYPGCLFGVTVSHYIRQNEKNPEYNGQEANRITSFWKVGERVPGVTAAGAGAGKGPGAASQAAAAAGGGGIASPPVPTAVIPTTAIEEQIPARPIPIAAEVVAPPVTPPAAIVSPQTLAPIPVTPAIPTAAGPVTPPSPPINAGPAVQVPCGICNQMIDVTELAAHVGVCAAKQGVT